MIRTTTTSADDKIQLTFRARFLEAASVFACLVFLLTWVAVDTKICICVYISGVYTYIDLTFLVPKH